MFTEEARAFLRQHGIAANTVLDLRGYTQVQTTARQAHLAAGPVRMAADAVAQNLRQSLG